MSAGQELELALPTQFQRLALVDDAAHGRVQTETLHVGAQSFISGWRTEIG